MNPSHPTPDPELSIHAAIARTARDDRGCELVHSLLNAYLARSCQDKHNTMEGFGPQAGEECPCTAGRCQVAEIPEYRPCISVRWGDSRCDCLESDDLEVVCITVCNCYSNISFSHFSVAAVYVTDENGQLLNNDLPDGGHSVQALPLGPFCFGDIPPCDLAGMPGCVSRQFVLRLRGARSGRYQLHLAGVCYDITTHHGLSETFAFNVCAD